MTPPVYRFDQTTPAQLSALTGTEWLLTNQQGGFAMGTVSGVPTRRYHGLLVASLRPPVNRILGLHSMAESLVTAAGTPLEERIELATFRFSPGVLHPRGDQNLTSFSCDHTHASWTFRVGLFTVVKAVHLLHLRPGVVVRYHVSSSAPARARLSLRPLVALRDFHALVLRDLWRDRFATAHSTGGVTVASPAASLTVRAHGASYRHDEQWWHNFQYDLEQSRGYDYLEDLLSPGEFVADFVGKDLTVTLHAELGPVPRSAAGVPLGQGADVQSVRLAAPPALDRAGPTLPDPLADAEFRKRRMDDIVTATRVKLGSAFTRRGPLAESPLLPHVAALVAAADQFVVQRVRPGALAGAPADRETIMAGYPWFADWGRDSMIALPGLLLTTGRFTEARKVLETFASACKDGLIPNVFDDYTGQAHYNTVDAALWFIQAACRYFDATGDDEFFINTLLPACTEIVTAYAKGTHFGIGADPADGLVSAGDASTQLTWMDAKRDGVVFTPRHGKPVEINALWHSGLRQLAHYAQALAPSFAATCAQLASRTGTSFAAAFWNERDGCLYDVITPHGPDASIRPNQLLAVSLPHCPLSKYQQRSIVEVVLRDLYTPHGVRTLAPNDPNYKPRYKGRMFERDAAYHNGTAWPWLMGPLAEAICRADDFSPAALARAQSVIGPLLGSLQDGCLGQLSEVYDAQDEQHQPQQPGGCPAQAWSVSEALRVVVIIARGQAGIVS